MPVAPPIKTTGSKPTKDGDFNLYTSKEGAGKPWFNTGRRVIFVNGMDNSPDDHMKSALGLSLLQACPVIGVYNKTEGKFKDLLQCLTDKTTFGSINPSIDANAKTGAYREWKIVAMAVYAAVKKSQPTLTMADFMHKALSANKATAALYAYLVNLGASERAKLKIYAHSQGNLITANALCAVGMALGDAAISGIEVNSFGSPCRYWPPGLKRTNYAFTFDPVTWLDYRIGFDNVKVGFVAAHGFDVYRQYDGEFICNRFRWGSFGMTASMDEKGLADFLVGISDNFPRVEGVIDRLLDAHWSDSDDVALLFVQAMKKSKPHVMKSMATHKPSLVKKLIKCLDDGWTTGAEYAAMGYLKGL